MKFLHYARRYMVTHHRDPVLSIEQSQPITGPVMLLRERKLICNRTSPFCFGLIYDPQ